tara:strand:- start:1282 stop:3675 length:2394 start_codon:yes stop_codon:yes gene_type:complete
MRLCEARGWYKPDKSIESRIYCFGKEGGTGGSAGDFEGTNFAGDTATAGGSLSGRGGPQSEDRRVQASGSTTNINIDRSEPSVTANVNGTTRTVYGTQRNLDRAVASGDLNVTPSPSDTYSPKTDKAKSTFSAASSVSPFMQERGPGTIAGQVPSSFEIDPVDAFRDPRAIDPTKPPVSIRTLASPVDFEGVMFPGGKVESTTDLSLSDAVTRSIPLTDDFEGVTFGDVDVTNPNLINTQVSAALKQLEGPVKVGTTPETSFTTKEAVKQLFKDNLVNPEETKAAVDRILNTENLLDAIQQQESSTIGGLVSDFDDEGGIRGSAGEVGRFQVLPSTAVNPGYGITPIANTEEEARVLLNDPTISRDFAREYLEAAQRRFPGDLPRQIASYNRGIAGASRLEDPEADAYVQGVLSNLDTRQTAPAPVANQGIASVQGVDVARFTDPLTGGVSDTPTSMSEILDYYETPGATLKLTTGDDAYKSSLSGDPEGYMTPEEVKAFENQQQDIFAPPAGLDSLVPVDTNIPQMSLAPESDASRFFRENEFGQVAGPVSLADNPNIPSEVRTRIADDVLQKRIIDEAAFGDPSKISAATPGLRMLAELGNTLESAAGGNRARKISEVASRPGGAFVRDSRGEIKGAVGPESNLRSFFGGAKNAVYVGDPDFYQQGVELGTSTLGPDTNVRAIPTTNPFTGIREGEPGVDYSLRRPRDQDDDDGGPQPLLKPLFPIDPAAEQAPEEYVGRDVIGGGTPTGYQPRDPVQLAYTGLPTLAPVILRPTFQSRAPFSPLFGNLGQPRRS